MLAALVLGLAAVLAAGDTTCSASDSSCAASGGDAAGVVTGTDPYYWPMAMGHPSYYSSPPWAGPTDLQKSFAWQWFGPSGKRYEESFVAAVIDDQKNLYVVGDHTVYKMTEDGQQLWFYPMPAQAAADGPVIYRGKLFASTTKGHIFAVDMETGRPVWVVQASSYNGLEYSQLAAHQGVVVTKGDHRCMEVPFPSCSTATVRGLNATDGAVLWRYAAEDVLWDWFPQFPDDKSVIFMDKTGGLYKLELQTGELLWRASGLANSWTDGSQFVASNGLTYTVQVLTTDRCDHPHVQGSVFNCPGFVTAYSTSDGSRVWQARVPKPPNSSPVVGRLGKQGRPVLIMPIGQQSQAGCQLPGVQLVFETLSFLPMSIKGPMIHALNRLSVWLEDSNWLLWGSMTRTHDLVALDPETGKHLWTWQGPTSHRKCNYGDEDGFITRHDRGLRSVCCPTPWGQPRIDSAGTIYVANENGDVYALRDLDGNGNIDGESEVSVYRTKGTFPHSGTAHAPGLLVAVNFDGVFVWKS